MDDFPRVKLVVLGDSGVGKTSFVQCLCNGATSSAPSWTVGCNLEVKVHACRTGGGAGEQPFSLEFWDVGGCPAHQISRSVFQENAHGIILVYDLSNNKSHLNLHKWMNEVLDNAPNSGLERINSSSRANGSQSLPFLVVGMKSDLVKGGRRSRPAADCLSNSMGDSLLACANDSLVLDAPCNYSFAREFGYDEIYASTKSISSEGVLDDYSQQIFDNFISNVVTNNQIRPVLNSPAMRFGPGQQGHIERGMINRSRENLFQSILVNKK